MLHSARCCLPRLCHLSVSQLGRLSQLRRCLRRQRGGVPLRTLLCLRLHLKLGLQGRHLVMQRCHLLPKQLLLLLRLLAAICFRWWWWWGGRQHALLLARLAASRRGILGKHLLQGTAEDASQLRAALQQGQKLLLRAAAAAMVLLLRLRQLLAATSIASKGCQHPLYPLQGRGCRCVAATSDPLIPLRRLLAGCLLQPLLRLLLLCWRLPWLLPLHLLPLRLLGRRRRHGRLEGVQLQGCKVLRRLPRAHVPPIQLPQLRQRRRNGKAVLRLAAHRVACSAGLGQTAGLASKQPKTDTGFQSPANTSEAAGRRRTWLAACHLQLYQPGQARQH